MRTVALLVLPLALAACESNYARSARIAREGRRLIADTGRFSVGPPSRAVRVGRATVVRGGGTLAAVVELRNTGEISNDVMHRIERELDLEDERLEI